MATFSTVAAITGTGSVFAVAENGARRLLKVGDELQKGETIQTVGDVRVELMMEDGQLMAVAPNQTILLDGNVADTETRPTAQDSAITAPAAAADTVIEALDRGGDLNTQLDATAAGLTGGAGADGGSTFVQLLRITEGTDPLAFNYAINTNGTVSVNPNGTDSYEVNIETRYVELGPDGQPLVDTNGAYVYLDGSDVTEGTAIGVLVSLDNPPINSDLVLTLSNGLTVTVPVGASTGFVKLDVRPDEANIQGTEVVDVGVTGAEGGGYTTISIDQSTAINVVDDNDVTTVTLSAAPSVAEGGAIVYSATVDNAVAGQPLIITLSNGSTITIPVGETTANSEPVAVRPDDVYTQGDANVTVSITNTAGGNFEVLDTTSTATTVVTDTNSPVNVSIASNGDVNEAQAAGFTVSVSQALDRDLTVTLSTNDTVVIKAGQLVRNTACLPRVMMYI